MRIVIIRLFMVYLPLAFVALFQVIVLLTIHGGSIGGPNGTTIDLSTHVTGLRFGWPLLVPAATIYHVIGRRRTPENGKHLGASSTTTCGSACSHSRLCSRLSP